MDAFKIDRRGLIKLGFGSAFGLLASRYAAALPSGKSKDKTACIILWMRGGASQLDTFDPKPGHRNGGGVRAIKTAVPGLMFAESLPQLADHARDLLVVRSLSSTEGDHSRATYFVKTGQKPLAAMRHPAFGAVAATAAPAGLLPPFVRLGPSSQPGQAYLPSQYAPFLVNSSGRRIRDLDPPAHVTAERQERRAKLLAELDESFEKAAGDDALTEPRKVAMDKAREFRGRPERAAFDLDQESKMIRQRYGPGFGQGCLLARRLIENGVRCVEVEFGGWDTHNNNAERSAALARSLDQGFAALIDDLKQRERLSSTLILCLSEFGRTPVINRNDGRDHYPRAFSAVLAGRGIRAGTVFGATSPDGLQVDKPVTIPELFATCTKALGLDPRQEFTAGDRPMKISEAPIRKELLA